MAILLFACQQSEVLSGSLPLHAPSAIVAGDTITVTVGPVTVEDGIHVGLVMVGRHGPRLYQSRFEQGIARFDIPGEHTLEPGFFAFIAASQDARGEIGMIFYPNPQRRAMLHSL